MSSIDGLGQIIQILRQKLTERSPAAIQQKNIHSTTARAQTSAEPRASIDEVKRKIGERIKFLPPGQKREVKAAHIFVDMVLAWEFGDRVLEDPMFTELTKEVIYTITENPKVWKQMQVLLNELSY